MVGARRCLVLAAAGFVVCLLSSPARAQGVEEFQVEAALEPVGAERLVKVTARIAEKHYLYAADFKVSVNAPARLEPRSMPEPETKYDSFSDAEVGIYHGTQVFRYALMDAPGPVSVTVSYRGCSEEICFFPQKKVFELGGASVPDAPPVAAPVVGSPTVKPDGTFPGFTVVGRAGGYLPTEQFLSFLDRVEAGRGLEAQPEGNLGRVLADGGVWAVLLAILLGGLALNLTPCVLPMIPINIAIIGAGVHGGSRARGFLLGTTYGLGIALAYGILGLVVVLTGARFGTLNASPAFNFAIAGLFVVMALAMFGAFNIDFSRFQGGVQVSESARGRYFTALGLGAVAALLAGACVAPVVISVLLWSARLYTGGQPMGLLLPFLLGLGMALPWPFAGAGLSFLPKPGAWMEWTKRGFGVVILLAALWYGREGWTLIRGGGAVEAGEGWLTTADEALLAARRENKPILVDFWAHWCKNCLHMDATTFRDPAVVQRLAGYVKLKYPAEDLEDPATKAALDEVGVEVGLPAYVVLKPMDAAP